MEAMDSISSTQPNCTDVTSSLDRVTYPTHRRSPPVRAHATHTAAHQSEHTRHTHRSPPVSAHTPHTPQPTSQSTHATHRSLHKTKQPSTST